MTSAADRPLLIWPTLAVAVSGALWGLFWMPARMFEAGGISGMWLNVSLFTLATLATLPLAWVKRAEIMQITKPQIVTGILMSTAFTAYTLSLLLTTVVNSVLMFYLTPVWSSLLGVLIFGERIGPARILALVLGIGGLLAILDVTAGIPLPRNAGDWLALLGGLSWAIGSLRSYRLPQPSITTIAFCFTLTGTIVSLSLVLALPASVIGPVPSMAAVQIWLPGIAAISMLLFVPSNFLLMWGTQQLPAPRVGILLMTEVVAAVASAALWSGEPFGLPQALGFCLIIGAGVAEVASRTVGGMNPGAASARVR